MSELAIEEKYKADFETFAKECFEKKIPVNKAKIKDKKVRIGMYLTNYGDKAFEIFKNDVSKMDQSGNLNFDYNKLTSEQKEIYTSLNYIQNTKERDRRLREGVERLMNGEEFRKFLEFNARFHTYSFNNTMLIYIQKPDATYVAGLGKWKKEFDAGGINKGEKGILISRPNIKEFDDEEKLKAYLSDPKHAMYFMDNEKANMLAKLQSEGKVTIVTSFSYTRVWDVSQIHDKDNQPLKLNIPNIRKQIGKDYADYEMVKQALNNISEVPIKYAKNVEEDGHLAAAYGYYSSTTDSITVRDAGFEDNGEVRSEQDCIHTVIHEMAHSILHGNEMRVQGIKSTKDLPKSEKEIEAESVAFMVCDHLGIDASGNSFGYLASYLPNDPEDRYKQMEKSLKRVNQCADAIIEKLDKELEKLRITEKHYEWINGNAVVDAAEDITKSISTLQTLTDIANDLLENVDRDEAPDIYEQIIDCVEDADAKVQFLKQGKFEADDIGQVLSNIIAVIEEDMEAADDFYVETLNDTYNYDTVLKEAKELLNDFTRKDLEIEKDDNR